MVVGRLLSYSEANFSGAMLDFGRVKIMCCVNFAFTPWANGMDVNVNVESLRDGKNIHWLVLSNEHIFFTIVNNEQKVPTASEVEF